MAIQGARPRDGSLISHLLVRDAKAACEFYARAFGARELYRSPLPGGAGLHVKLKIAEALVWVTDESPPDMEEPGHMAAGLGSPQTLCGTSVLLELCVDDADAWFDRAVKEGASPTLPMGEAFWGDRYGWVTDPFGHIWALSSVQVELTPREVTDRMSQFAN